MENKITAICQECDEQFQYNLKPGFPRKYCFECSEKKKASFNAESVPVEKPGVPKEPKGAITDIQVGVYTSYAKDIFCAIFGAQPYGKSVLGEDWTIEEYMQVAIKLVKQAKEAFE